MQYQDLIDGNTELISDDLREGSFFSLPMWRGARIDHHGATLLNAHTRTFVEANRCAALWPEAADLDIGGEADTHQLTITCGTSASLFSTQGLVVRYAERLVQGCFVVASIIDRTRGRLVGELIWFDEVQPAHLSRVFAQFSRNEVDNPLRDIGRFRAARAAIGVGGRFVGENDVGAEMDVLDVVSPTGNREAEGNHNHIGEKLAIGTKIRDAMHLESGNFAFFCGCNLDIVYLVTSMYGDCYVFAAVFDPFHRASKLH